MVDIIVVLIVVILLGFALKGSIKHFKGDSPCCGGGGGTVVLIFRIKNWISRFLERKFSRFPVCTANTV